MRRIKVILAVVTAVATVMVAAAPAMAQETFCDLNGLCWTGSSNVAPEFGGIGVGFIPAAGVDECFLVWSWWLEDWVVVCTLD